MTRVAVPEPMPLTERMTELATKLGNPDLRTVWVDVAAAAQLLNIAAGELAKQQAPLREALTVLRSMEDRVGALLVGPRGDRCYLCGAARECPCCVTNAEECYCHDD